MSCDSWPVLNDYEGMERRSHLSRTIKLFQDLHFNLELAPLARGIRMHTMDRSVSIRIDRDRAIFSLLESRRPGENQNCVTRGPARPKLAWRDLPKQLERAGGSPIGPTLAIVLSGQGPPHTHSSLYCLTYGATMTGITRSLYQHMTFHNVSRRTRILDLCKSARGHTVQGRPSEDSQASINYWWFCFGGGAPLIWRASCLLP